MRMGVALVLLVSAATLPGCLAGEEQGSPNLRTPRLVVDGTPDNLTVLYVHAAFTNEHLYDDMRLRLDNATATYANHTYALTHKTNRTAFFLDVDVWDGADRFRYQARLRVNASADVLNVAAWDARQSSLGPASNTTLPFKKVVPTYQSPTVEE